MQYTNYHNLPERWTQALEPEQWESTQDVIGVTSLVDAPRIRQLRLRHGAEIVEDFTDLAWRFSGQAFHKMMELSAMPGAMVEHKVSMEMDGMTVRGIVDYFRDGHLVDFKETSVWSAIFNPLGKASEMWQVNFYAEMLRGEGITVASASLDRKLRDWNVREMMKNPDYPRYAVPHIVPVELFEPSTVRAKMADRIRLHTDAARLGDDELPACTDEERWRREETWAVIKAKAKKASRVRPTLEEAEAWRSKQKDPAGYRIEHRLGEAVRCTSYCSVRQFCNTYLQEQAIAEEEATERERENSQHGVGA